MGDQAEPAAGAAWPELPSLAEVQYVGRPHPALIPLDDLTRQCRLTAHRRGGPGGQHRNKVSSAVMALHLPTSVSAEANERRDQSENRRVALERLRLRLAIVLRSGGDNDSQRPAVETELRARWQGRPLKIGDSNFERSAVLALVMDDLHRAGGQPSLVAAQWKTSTTSLVHFVASVPAAFQLLNRWREHHHRPALKP